MVLEQAPEPAAVSGVDSVSGVGPVAGGLPVLVWPFSAKTPEALAARAGQLAQVADGVAVGAAGGGAGGVGFTLAVSRAGLEHRAVVVGGDLGEVRAGLEAVAAGADSPLAVRGTAGGGGGLAVVFPGQGSVWAGAGRDLCERSGVFAAAVEEVCGLLGPAGARARTVICGPDGGPVTDTGIAQPVLLALGVGLWRLLGSWGITPGWVAGHSVGEIAAAHAAGVLSLADACTLVAARAELMAGLPPGGAMASVPAPEAEVAAAVGQVSGVVALAAVNAPASVVISGDADAVAEVAARFPGSRPLHVSHAFHSPHMDPAVAGLHAVAAGLSYRPPSVAGVSSVTGEAAGGQWQSPRYWADQIREPVRWAAAAAALAGLGAGTFAEAGPGGVLSGLIAQAVPGAGCAVLLRRGQPGSRSVLAGAALLHARGHTPDWAALLGRDQIADLPGYPFARRRLWLDATPAAPARQPAPPAGLPHDHRGRDRHRHRLRPGLAGDRPVAGRSRGQRAGRRARHRPARAGRPHRRRGRVRADHRADPAHPAGPARRAGRRHPGHRDRARQPRPPAHPHLLPPRHPPPRRQLPPGQPGRLRPAVDRTRRGHPGPSHRPRPRPRPTRDRVPGLARTWPPGRPQMPGPPTSPPCTTPSPPPGWPTDPRSPA